MRSPSAPCVLAATSVLTACAGSGGGVPDAPRAAAQDALLHTEQFKYTGEEQFFKVPADVTSIVVDASGAAGAGQAGGGEPGQTRLPFPRV